MKLSDVLICPIKLDECKQIRETLSKGAFDRRILLINYIYPKSICLSSNPQCHGILR